MILSSFRILFVLFLSVTTYGWSPSYQFQENHPLFQLRGGDLSNDANIKIFPASSPPYLAIITEPDACDTDEAMEKTIEAIRRATSNSSSNGQKDQLVALVSVRLTRTDDPDRLERALHLTKSLVQMSMENAPFQVVCSSDYIPTALKANAHGIHVKEAHLAQIPEIRQSFASQLRRQPLIGTSTHSVESALASFQTYHPDYYFVGTCYTTLSHPEKSTADLEGPKLPGEVRRALVGEATKPKVLAIGGIDDNNCHEPMLYGADGVATIRAVLQADNPAHVVSRLHSRMEAALRRRRPFD